MSHVTHMNESCHTQECVRSHIWMSHVSWYTWQPWLQLTTANGSISNGFSGSWLNCGCGTTYELLAVCDTKSSRKNSMCCSWCVYDVSWLIHAIWCIFEKTLCVLLLCVWWCHDSFMQHEEFAPKLYVLLQMSVWCVMNHAYVWHDSFICVRCKHIEQLIGRYRNEARAQQTLCVLLLCVWYVMTHYMFCD